MKKKKMIIMCSGDRASVRACARVWNVVFCLYFLIVFIIYAKKKRTAWWWSRCKISNKIWFDSLTGKENRQFPFRRPNTEREREKTHIYFCYFVCAWDECLSQGRSTLDVRYSSSVEWSNLSVSEKWIFRFFLFNQFFASLQVWIWWESTRME